MSRSHEPIILRPTRGMYDRDDTPQITTPEDFFFEAGNIEYYGDIVGTRRDFSSLAGTSAQVIRFYRFGRSTGAARYIWLDGAGNLYDTGSATPSVPIIAAATAGWGTPVDFSMVSGYDRAYITPHNRVVGLTGTFVWVYNPDWAGVKARKACGTRPGVWGAGSTTAAGGNCEPGLHLVAVVFETTSGFLTKISSTIMQFTCTAANRTISLAAIPTGTANVVVKRRILMTKVIPVFDGNPLAYEFFFVDTINDNVTTTYNISKFDTELVSSADYLEDMLEEIPAGIAIGEYRGSLCIAGEQANPGIVRVSVKGEWEAMAATDGFVNFNSSDGRGIRALIDDGDTLRVFKSARSMWTNDNGGPPNTWVTHTSDGDQGCEFLGIGRMFESGSVDSGSFVVGNSRGLYLFDGGMNAIPLSLNIDRFWQANAATAIDPIQIAIDGQQRRIYCKVGSTYLLVGDCTYGKTPDTIRWYYYTFLNSIGQSAFTNAIAATSGGVIVSTTAYDGLSQCVADVHTGLDHWGGKIQLVTVFAGVPKNSIGGVVHFSEWRLAGIRSSGLGNITVNFGVNFDAVQTQTPQTFPANTFQIAPKTYGSTIAAQGGMMSVAISTDAANAQVLYYEYLTIFQTATSRSK